LQALLTHHHLELAIRKRQHTHIALPPFDGDTCGGGIGTGDFEHAGIEVHADDVPEVALPLDSHAGNNPRPTCRIQDAVAGGE
jgi:hypothetical protein